MRQFSCPILCPVLRASEQYFQNHQTLSSLTYQPWNKSILREFVKKKVPVSFVYTLDPRQSIPLIDWRQNDDHFRHYLHSRLRRLILYLKHSLPLSV